MRFLIFFACLLAVGTSRAQVGIGTTSPSTNAVLDLTSTTKGLLLPRLNDTATVRNPSAGLMIYSKQTQGPAYHNGTRWNTLAAKTTASRQDSITYTITGASTGYTNGTLGAYTVSSGLSNPYTSATGGGGSSGRVTFEDVILTKPVDANSVGFVRTVSTGSSSSMVIEFKVFAAGSSTPTYSIKVTGPHIVAYHVNLGSGAKLAEQITLVANIYGYKNWVTGQSFAWNLTTNTTATY